MSSKDEALSSSPEQNLQKDYEILSEDCPNYDFSFKVIIIGNSGNFIFILYKNIKYRSWKNQSFNTRYKICIKRIRKKKLFGYCRI
jgi:hypothetical protein